MASRDAAYRALFALPEDYDAFMRSFISDSEMWEALQCDDRSIEDDWMPRQFMVNHSAVGAKRFTPCRSSNCLHQHLSWDMRGCENAILSRPRMAPEAYISYSFVRAGLTLADSCPITGTFVNLGSHNPFEVIESSHAAAPRISNRSLSLLMALAEVHQTTSAFSEKHVRVTFRVLLV